MARAGEIKYCDLLGGRNTNAAFVYIPPSAFWMGDASDQHNPIHLVGVSKGFWIQQTAMTDEQYQYLTNKNTPGSTNSKNPKTEVSWDNVSKLVHRKSLRLPTEAEWELAARAGVAFKYKWAGSNVVNNVAWTSENSNTIKHHVAELKSNSFGLYDSTGNVFAFCSDWYSSLASTPQRDPQGPASGSLRVYRGGSWNFSPRVAWVVRRFSRTPDYSSDGLGVRLTWEI